MRQLVRASLPLGDGIVLDPFMGGGPTIAAALAVGYDSIGIEIDPAFFKIAERAIPKLAEIRIEGKSLALRSSQHIHDGARILPLPF